MLGDYLDEMHAAEAAHLDRVDRHVSPEPTLHIRDAIDAAESTASLHKVRDTEFGRADELFDFDPGDKLHDWPDAVNDLGDEYAHLPRRSHTSTGATLLLGVIAMLLAAAVAWLYLTCLGQ